MFIPGKPSSKPLEEMTLKELEQTLGFRKTTEIVGDWNRAEKKGKKKWKKLKNDFFTTYYPTCYEPFGQIDEMDPVKSGSVRFEKTKKCSNFKLDIRMPESVTIELASRDEKDPMNMGGHGFKSDVVILNGKKASIALSLDYTLDENVMPAKKILIHLSWSVIFNCNKKTFVASTSELYGEPSLKRIREKNFDPPQDFKDIVANMECK